MRRIAWCFCLGVACILSPTPSAAELNVYLDDEHFLVLEATDLPLLAVEIQSPSGSLLPSPISTPFQGVLTQGDSLALYYNLGDSYLLNGAVRLGTQWDPLKRNDILFQYGTPTTDEGLQPIAGHQIFAGGVSPEPIVVEPPDLDNPIILALPDSEGTILYTSAPMVISELVVTSTRGWLVPNGNLEPFEMAGTPNSQEVRYQSDAGVELYGSLEIPVGWTGTTEDDLFIELTTVSGELFSADVALSRNAPEPSGAAWWLMLCLGGMLQPLRGRPTRT